MRDNRPTLTLKGPQFTKELRDRLNRAAQRHRMTQADFAAMVLDEGIKKYLWKDPAPTKEEIILSQLQEILRRLEADGDAEVERAVQINVRAPEGSRDLFHRMASALRENPKLVSQMEGVLPR